MHTHILSRKQTRKPELEELRILMKVITPFTNLIILKPEKSFNYNP